MIYRSQHPRHAPAVIDYASHQPQPLSPESFEQSPSLPRKFAEVFVYAPIIVAAFVTQLGIIQIPKLGGAIQLVCGGMVVGIIVLTGARFTLTIWFALAINLCATISQVIGQGALPVVGGGLPGLLFWFFNLLGTWYVVQNRSAERRMVIFYVLFLGILTTIGGSYMKTHKVERLGLEGVGGGMANPNTIAYMAGLFSVSLLFWSLRCKPALRPILWILAFLMFVALLRTVSRTGLGLFAGGFLCYLVAVFAGKGMRTSGLVFLGFAVIAGSQLTYFIADQLIFFQKRLEIKTAEGRLGIYQTQTLVDLAGTFFIGKGPDEAQMTSTGIQAHNTFVFVHMCWGGMTAYVYATWLIILGVRVTRFARCKEVPIDLRMQVLAFYLMALGGEFTNNINFYAYSSVYAFGVIEKYSVAFSRKKIAERHYQTTAMNNWYPPTPQLAYGRR